MYCDHHDFEDDRRQRCGLLAGHDPPCIDASAIACSGCGVQGLALAHACSSTGLVWRRTEWYRLAFGGWARCRPPDYAKEVLARTSEGISLERLPRRSWDGDTDPG